VTETEARPALSSRAIMAVLVPLTAVVFIATLDQTIVATALPGIGSGLHDLAGVSWVATSYLLTSAVSTLILGKLGDMYGRKKVVQFSVIVFLAGSLAAGLAPSMGLLIVFRALQGIGGGGLSSLVQAITGDLIPARQRAKYQSYVGVVATLAIVLGPLLGGLFVDHLSWRWIFFINLPIGLFALVAIAARLHLPVRRTDRSADVTGGLVVTLTSTAALLITVWGGSRFAWGSAVILGLAVAAIAGLAIYLWVERRAAEPITPLHLFRSRVFAVSCALFFLSTVVLFAAMIYVPMLMQAVHHYSAFGSGLFLIPLLVGLIAATAVSGSIISSTGRYKIFPVLGAILSGAGMGMVGLLPVYASVWLLGFLLFVVGAGLGFFVQVSVLAGQNAVEQQYLGVATGALNFFKTLGGAFGAALFGAILLARGGGFHAFQTVFLWTVPFMGLALVLSLVMKEKPLSDDMLEVVAGNAEIAEY
jgi:EmrB/QacA subfamily drug resistance transporter